MPISSYKGISRSSEPQNFKKFVLIWNIFRKPVINTPISVNNDHTETQNLIALKRYESPSDEYFEEFLEEFHHRQREDVLKRSARSLFMERLSVWFKELGMAKWAYGAGVAYAALMIGFVAWPKGADTPTADLPGNRNLEHVDGQELLLIDKEKDSDMDNAH